MPPVATILGAELPLKLSPTFLERAACPLCLKWTYVDKLTTSSSRMSALRGAAAHLAIAVLTKRCLDEKILPSRLSDEHLRGAIAEATPHEIYAQIGPIFEWVSLWRERFHLQSKQLVGFEERMAIGERFEEAAWSEAAYRGIVDVIHIRDRTAIVTDYKSQPNILSQAALDQHDKGSFYCWLVSKFYPQIEEFVFRLWYLRYGFYAETRRSRRQLDLFEQQLLVRKQKITEIERWEPVAGDHCGVCDFNHLCPLGQAPSPLASDLVTPDQAVQLASELRVKEEWVKRARGKLKVYVEKNEDPIELAGYAYGFRAIETVQHDASVLVDPLRDHDLPLSDYLAGKSKPLAKLLKNLDEGSDLREQLEAARTVKRATKFRGYKLAGDDETTGDEEE
jgi:hypothetical protein